MRCILSFYAVFILGIIGCLASEPIVEDITPSQCQGSLMPYPANIVPVATPDSLKPVMINHVGRHGARYPASSANCMALRRALLQADSLGTITYTGRQLLDVTDHAIALSQGRWGALDSLGEAEQRGIAARMYKNFTDLFTNADVAAISSYSPRCMMSMYAFTHQLDCLNNHINFITTSGRVNDQMLRPFDIDEDYMQFRKGDAVKEAYDAYFASVCPTTAIERALGAQFPYRDDAHKRELAITEYYVIAGLSAMSVQCDALQFFTRAEYCALWSCFNIRQYLQRTATVLSDIPAKIATPLLADLISSIDAFIDGTSEASVLLRFGHAETLMPLLSLMRLPGCYYLSDTLETVAQHWQDFHVVPMAANLQIILFQSLGGEYYVRFDLNEQPVQLIPGCAQIYIPWSQAKAYLLQRILA